ncbi:MAG TPA: hypothetical protein VEK15_03740, partial [Vicinamibacteria bacterium]|nr:hypothetical protein [Vicinamibacteria bacterium]
SGVVRAQTGQPITRTFIVRGLNQGTQTIKAETVGSQRLSSVGTADITVAKDFVLGAGRLEVAGSLFNIFNANTISDINLASGSSYGQVLNFLSPRIFRIGVKYRF